jgi:FMN phosphatase YigB (HAD superfamily)
VASFDIFDTVLTRRVGDPRAAFLLLGRRLATKGLIGCSAESFARHRTAAEVRSFRNAGGLDSDVSIQRIYAELGSSLSVSAAQLPKLIDEELDLESDILVPLKEGTSRLAEARQHADRVVFVSDMYLPGDFLKEQLHRHNLFQSGDQLFVSNEHQKSKATGKLWPDVLNELSVPASAVCHTGNDRNSDHKSAKKAGMRTTLLDHCNLNRFESELETWSFDTDGLTSLLAGASRLARIEVGARDEHERALRDVSAGVVAPFVIGNVLWLLQRAIEDDLKKIFFIARDGQVLLDVARELAPKVGYTGELKYLYGSRQAWTLPGMVEINDQVLATVAPSSGDVDHVTVRHIAHRFGVEPEYMRAELIEAGFAESAWDTKLTADDCLRLQSMIRDDSEMQPLLLSIAGDHRALMVKYLEQEGVITDEPIAIVDQGTGGTLYNALSTVLDTVGQAPPMAFYFGIRSDVADQGFGFPEAYVRDEHHGTGFLRTPGLLTMVEMACTADHGSVVGYEDLGSRMAAQLSEPSNAAVVDWGFEVVRRTVRQVARELRIESPTDALAVDLRPSAIAVFESFWQGPTRSEATAWGRYPFEDGWGADSVSLPLAHKQGVRAAVRSQPHRHWWKAGAQALSGPVPRTLLRSREEAKEVVRKARNRVG